jgi:hypothetical protein
VDTRDPRHFAQAVVRLCKLYQERDALLGPARRAQHRRTGAAAAARGGGNQRVWCALRHGAGPEGVLDEVLYPLSLILREAGAAGVHVLIEDQVVDQRWPRGISANAEPVTGYLPVNYGAAGGYYDAHKLAPYQFHFAGTVFGTWPMAAVLPLALAGVQRRQAATSVSRTVSKETFPGVSWGVSPEVDPPPAAPGNAPPVNVAQDASGWHEYILAYMNTPDGAGLWQSPARGVRALARAMSRHATGDEEAEDSYVSIASKVAADIRATSIGT